MGLIGLTQERQECARHAHNAPEIDCKQPVKVVGRNVLELPTHRDARIVEQKICLPVSGLDLIAEARDVVRIADIDPACRDRPFAARAGCGDLFQPGLVQVCEREVAAPTGQGSRQRRAYATGRTGDDGDPAVKCNVWHEH